MKTTVANESLIAAEDVNKSFPMLSGKGEHTVLREVSLTVQENVELGLEARGVHRDERRQRALKAIDLVGLDGFESAYPKELSGGMKQRVGFDRTI